MPEGGPAQREQGGGGGGRVDGWVSGGSEKGYGVRSFSANVTIEIGQAAH